MKTDVEVATKNLETLEAVLKRVKAIETEIGEEISVSVTLLEDAAG